MKALAYVALTAITVALGTAAYLLAIHNPAVASAAAIMLIVPTILYVAFGKQ